MSEDIQFNLRVPPALKQKIKDARKTSNRSINKEATFRLEQSFEPQSNSIEDASLEQLLAEVAKRMNKCALKLVLVKDIEEV